MSHNGILVNIGISFGHFITLVVDWMQNITLYHKGAGGALEGVNFVSWDKWTVP